jgi:sorbitol-specific phosphotransferase system component IIBC
MMADHGLSELAAGRMGVLSEQSLKIVAVPVLLLLVLPGALILSVVALLIARGLGVPLFTPSPFPGTSKH